MSTTKKKAAPAVALKQGSLFSFFAKKPPAAPKLAKAAGAKPSSQSQSASQSATNADTNTNTDANTNTNNTNTNNTNATAATTAARHTHPGRADTAARRRLLSRVHVGCTVAVYWPDDGEYYPARVTGRAGGSRSVYTLIYDDGEVETIDLAGERFRFVGAAPGSNEEGSNQEEGEEEEEEAAAGGRGAGGGGGRGGRRAAAGRRRVVAEDEEFEFDDEASSEEEASADDGSEEEFVFEDTDEDDDEELDEDALMVTDEDEEDGASARGAGRRRIRKAAGGGGGGGGGRKSAKRLRVTREGGGRGTRASSGATPAATTAAPKNGATSSSRASFITPPDRPASRKAQAAAKNSFADFALDPEAAAAEDAAPAAAAAVAAAPTPRPVTQSQAQSQSPLPPVPAGRPEGQPAGPFVRPAKPLDRVVNPAGTHWHNHLRFLHPRHVADAQGRTPESHPGTYDPRTLRVDYGEIERVRGAKITPAARQWWDIKARYADTLLLFKTGKFYEIFHHDADVAVRVLGMIYMKGCDAHAGFPEQAYGRYSASLVRAGYRVARVEQTETPDMLRERKKRTKGPKPQVVNREVCSVMTAGTRTFCYLDSQDALRGEQEDAAGGGGTGPLLTIKEALIEAGGGEGDGEVKPVCEYGVAIVDAVRGSVTLGQFADDVLRSRMVTLLATFAPSEIIVEGGTGGASDTLVSLLKSACPSVPLNKVNQKETLPKSTAIDVKDRKRIERPSPSLQPWDVDETLTEIHRKGYYPRASRKDTAKHDKSDPVQGTARWPEVLRACVQGGASLALSAFGGALFYLQRGLVDDEILTMGIVKPYIPPATCGAASDSCAATEQLENLFTQEQRESSGLEAPAPRNENGNNVAFSSLERDQAEVIAMEAQIDHMALDGTTLANLEILSNAHSGKAAGSLWSKISFAKSPHGSRLLRAWLLRPLFRKVDIDRRADAVEELISGAPAAALAESRSALAKMGDVERLLSRVHSMGGSGGGAGQGDLEGGNRHPNDRAILYETKTYTKRKVGDFSKLLNGLRAAAVIPDLFEGVDIRSGQLSKIVRTSESGGYFPANLGEQLDWFFDNFDCKRAAQGDFEPTRGMDDAYDAACDDVERIKQELEDYKDEMCSDVLKPSHQAKGTWKYINVKEDSKDKYLIELPASIGIPDDFYVKGKRGSGAKQVNKYRTPVVEQLVQELEQALAVVTAGKARGMQLVFSKFDSMRATWAAAAAATAMLDALGALAEVASQPGFSRPIIRDCPPDGKPCTNIMQGRHPCVEVTHSGGDFVPNDLSLGGAPVSGEIDESRVLLLSGPNMGGKSTLLRQTCLITILAQIGCFVPADECCLTPVDRIFTRLGASDRILLGQSTFFVELAETAAALRGATRRSLVIMDELGRGTSTFDGTAIASAAVKHLVERNQCLALFATHYHSLLEDLKDDPSVRLGHMECVVEGGDDDDEGNNGMEGEEADKKDGHNITFLYTLGEGSCPKSFGINVARLAALPEEVLMKAKQVSANFEIEMNGNSRQAKVSPSSSVEIRRKVEDAVAKEDWVEVDRLWTDLQRCV